LPAGNELLESQLWQSVPGADAASVYPIIRKIDTVSSNSYLIRTPDALILIDPGGLADQLDHITGKIREIRQQEDLPLFVFLTHIHCDHFIAVLKNPVFAHEATAIFAVQDEGACALEQADRNMTLADLMQLELTPVKVGLHLFKKSGCGAGDSKTTHTFSCGTTITVQRDRCGGETGASLCRERISFEKGTEIEIFHLPGHSRDCICLRIGSLFFIGDVLFAANPGIAGLPGWNQKKLIRSLDGLQRVLSEGKITVICPGHGRTVEVADAIRMIPGIRADAVVLENIAEFNQQRSREIAAFAENCMEQVNELFTIMAGRLYYISYMMEELGESEMAGEISALINGDIVDELLDAFRAFADEHHKGDVLSFHLALKAGQVVAKLNRAFSKEEFSRILDPNLVRRAGLLLSDYSTMLRGFCPPREVSPCELRDLLGSIVTGLSIPACSDEELLSSSDDDAAFARMLLSRISTPPLLAGVELTFEIPAAGKFPVLIDRDHFADLVTYILEDLVGTGSDRIGIGIGRDGGNAVVTITGNDYKKNESCRIKPREFLVGLCERAGGNLTYTDEGIRRFVITTGIFVP
jgi:glyoxylase-like metal-dependent hydrolase (beta-lactamase superfamily II)